LIHYHGTPITPATAAIRAVTGGHAFVSYRHAEQLALVIEVASSFALDNGAFSAWRSGHPVKDWSGYYQWVDGLRRLPGFDFAVIPDVIDGNEEDNDVLLAEWPFPVWAGAPVWHMHESLDRLATLAALWPRVCLGSSGDFAQIGTEGWWRRMGEAMDALCDANGQPSCKLHGLRMLDPEVFTRLPFSSADSTNIAQNIGIDSKWKGTYTPASKESRAQVMRDRIESRQSPAFWDRAERQAQGELFELKAA
jgi:hypothetical protein